MRVRAFVGGASGAACATPATTPGETRAAGRGDAAQKIVRPPGGLMFVAHVPAVETAGYLSPALTGGAVQNAFSG